MKTKESEMTIVTTCSLSLTVEGRIEAKDAEEAKDILRKRIDRLFSGDAFQLLMQRLNKEDYDDLAVFYSTQSIKAKEE